MRKRNLAAGAVVAAIGTLLCLGAVPGPERQVETSAAWAPRAPARAVSEQVQPPVVPLMSEPEDSRAAGAACAPADPELRLAMKEQVRVCAGTLDRLGCGPRSQEPRPDRGELEAALPGLLEAHGCRVGLEDLSLDCSSTPCLLVAPDEATSEALAACAGEAPRLSTTSKGAIVLVDAAQAKRERWLEALKPSLTARIEANPGRRRIDDEADFLACDDDRVPVDCIDVAATLGCIEDEELALDEATYRRVLDTTHAKVAKLRETCRSFDEAEWYLDCERVPCVLAFTMVGEPPPFAGCVAGMLEGEEFRTTGHRDGPSMVPLTDLGWEDPALLEVLEQRWERNRVFSFQEIRGFVGTR